MRGSAVIFAMVLMVTPAFAGHAMMHDRMPLPGTITAFETSNGDPYNRQAAPVSRPSDIDLLAARLGIQKGHADFFRVSDRDSGTAVAGTVSNGALQVQFRWTPN
jgi:hypothetical protein